MSIFKAIILGAVQGLTEFLPVSSSGHLLLAERWLGVSVEGGLFFDIMLHIGTLVPVFIVFFSGIKSLFRPPFKRLWLLILATVPAALSGFLFQDKIESLYKGNSLFSAILLAFSFLLTAAELILSTIVCQKSRKALPLSAKSAIIMGVFQGVAVIPGLSRSGTVITGGLLSGLDRENSAEFAFLMSIPVVLGAAAVSGAKAVTVGAKIEVLPLFFGVLSAMTFGYIAVNATLKAVKKGRYTGFAVYLILLAVLSLLSNVIFGV